MAAAAPLLLIAAVVARAQLAGATASSQQSPASARSAAMAPTAPRPALPGTSRLTAKAEAGSSGNHPLATTADRASSGLAPMPVVFHSNRKPNLEPNPQVVAGSGLAWFLICLTLFMGINGLALAVIYARRRQRAAPRSVSKLSAIPNWLQPVSYREE
ncbi:MAG TPA: hypothetical protein VMV23_06515 [Candidatus Nanopelagicaceae bacterium]|nr:hypothetical protein [Candidatus Nanopelagicaceae bacterium]